MIHHGYEWRKYAENDETNAENAKDMERMQAEIAQRTVEASAGGGAVTVTASGNQEIQAVKINPDAVDRDIEMLEDMVLAATNEALKKPKK